MLRKLLLVVLVLAFSHQALAFPGETRRYFKDWLVNCMSDSAGTCRAVTSVRNKALFPYGDGTIFQLTVQRDKQNDYHIEFYHTLEGSYPADTATFQVDQEPVMTMKLDRTHSLNEGRLTNEQTRQLLPLLKSGRWLTISYTSQKGKEVELTLSLRGVTASLLFVDEHILRK